MYRKGKRQGKKMNNKSLLLVLSLFWYGLAFAEKEVAITIDDLPFVGGMHYRKGDAERTHERFLNIVKALDEEHVPTTGFVIAGSIAKGQWKLLELFSEHGYIVGNHTYTHPMLTQRNSEKYMQEVGKADQILSPLMNSVRYFRYPYLAEGRGEVKQKVQDYLHSLGYVIAPVTIDSKDFRFNSQFLAIAYRNRMDRLPAFKKRYLDYIWTQTVNAEKRTHNGKQILLIHANVLNSLCLPDILKMYKDHGYTFISLEDALKP